MTRRKEVEWQAEATESDPRWLSLLARDRGADGTFFYAVKTTGIYCRPGCGVRLARPENVCFYANASEAEEAGFRACKRCRPAGLSLSETNTAMVEKVCRLIERSESVPSLQALAEHAERSVFHLHRTFKSITGLTPRAYGAAHRAKRVRKTLCKSRTVTDAIYEAGFNSSSRFYEGAKNALGMTPTEFRNGGTKTVIHFAIGDCSLGSVLVARSDRGVCAIAMGDDPLLLVHNLQDQFPNADLVGDQHGYQDLVAKVIALVEKPGLGLNLPLDIRGTAFQQRVWNSLQRIPLGSTATYTEVAETMGMPRAARAVAQACAANTLAVAIPCHRVIRTDGSLSGYRWGVERKRALLDREKHVYDDSSMRG